MQLIVSDTHSPSFNLATEEYILTKRHDDVLFFYVNAKSVIIGRNQNAYAEVNVPFCKQEGIVVIRRLSGGGAVYHDEGNINFCFITRKEEKPLDGQWLSLIQASLETMGIHTSQGKRKELYLREKKITGTALHITAERQFFHGTLLYDVQLQNLIAALTQATNMTSKAVQSVRSNVTNILSYHPSSPTTPEFLSQLISFFADYYATQPMALSSSEKEQITQLQKERYQTWEWNWAQSPKSTCKQTMMWKGKSYALEIGIERGFIVSLSDNCPLPLQALFLGNSANQLFDQQPSDNVHRKMGENRLEEEIKQERNKK
jgi:lipoate-protein ligase A